MGTPAAKPERTEVSPRDDTGDLVELRDTSKDQVGPQDNAADSAAER